MADITLLATADWDYPIWTNKQHVACSFADLGHRVLYVESLGLRPIRLTRGAGRGDFRRILQRLCHGFRPPRRVRDNIWIWSPIVLPGVNQGWRLWLNRISLWIGLRWARFCSGMQADLLWTYNPLTLAILAIKPYGRLIYHCVDSIQAQPGMPASAIQSWEQLLCSKADAVFVTSPQLRRDLAHLNANTYFYPNVADSEHFAGAMSSLTHEASDLASIPRPRIGFVGAVSAYKLDLDLVHQLAKSHPQWSFVLVGPVGEGDPATDVKTLSELSNVFLLGERPYRDLPCYLKGFDIGLLPLRHNDYTRSMFPMKFFEYLAAGLPVVSTDIDALQGFAHLACLVPPKYDSFDSAICEVLAGGGPSKAQRLAGVAGQTYLARSQAMLKRLWGQA